MRSPATSSVIAALVVAILGLTAPAAAASSATGALRARHGRPGCATPRRGTTACQIAVARRAVRSALAGTTPVGYSPAQLQAAYQLPSPSYGAGKTVAVVAPFDDPDVAGDLAAYRSQYGQPACPQTLSLSAPQCLTVINQSGSLITPGSGTAPAANTSWALTTSAQLDAVSATCPNCTLLLVEVNSAAITDVGAGVNFAADLGASVITIGVAQPETNEDPAWDTAYFQHDGIEITAAAGDTGYSGNGVDYPAASQYVTAVGGTTLTPSGTGTCTAAAAGARGWCETAWDDSYGATVSGCSLYEPEPSWQQSGIPPGDTGCGSLRTVADVSADADPATGIAVYDSYGEGGWQAAPVGGTAVAAAIVGGADALAGTPASDSDPTSYLYANASGFNDITAGGGGTCSPAYLCTAGSGYDGPTGLGSPDGDSAFLASYYKPVTPDRLLDTRNGTGTGGTAGPVQAGAALAVQVTGAGGVPQSNVTAVAVNITATGESSDGNVITYPDGSPRPGTSTLNYTTGVTIANLAIVPVGADGKIDLFNSSGGTTQLVADVFGYFTSDASAAGDTTYTPVTATRFLDTRIGTGATKAQLKGGATLALQIGGEHGVPSGIAAVAINLTAVDESGNGFLEVYADGTARPAVSNLQFAKDRTTAEMAIVPVGADGKIDIYDNGGSSTDVVGDVSGYFTVGTSGEKYHAINATRLIDTRESKAVAADGTLTVTPGAAVVAPDADLVLNVTPADGTSDGILIVHPAGSSIPSTSNVNYTAGETIPNLALGQTGGGSVDIYNASGGTVELVIDCTGYFSAG
jgi:subtilase family serine protease